MSYTIEDRNGVHVLIGITGCRRATEAEVYFEERYREVEADLVEQTSLLEVAT